MIIRFTPDADAELAEARQWYAHQRESLDAEFMESIDDALLRITRTPKAYPGLQNSQARSRASLPFLHLLRNHTE